MWKPAIHFPTVQDPLITHDIFLVNTAQDNGLLNMVKNRLLKVKKTLKLLSVSDLQVNEGSWKHDVFVAMSHCARCVLG